MSTRTFYNESNQKSQVKSAIVLKYFDAWSNVIMGAQNKTGRRSSESKIAYVDLFSGPGRYSDGTDSTPLLVLRKALQNDALTERLETVFNDKDKRLAESLREAIRSLPGVEKLKYRPRVSSFDVDLDIVNKVGVNRAVPTLFFVDPWGYKGISHLLVNSLLTGWGCDCILFFNYLRVNMGLDNEVFRKNMNDLFGEVRADELRQKLGSLDPNKREMTIVENFSQAIKDAGTRFVWPFRFKQDAGMRTSHYLILISKHQKGYSIMKDIMAKESSDHQQGVASFEYNPAHFQQPLLINVSRPLDELKDMLLRDFAGRKIRMRDIYEQHNVGKPFTAKNYKDALTELDLQEKVTTSKRKKNTFGDNVLVTFPNLGEQLDE